jgi:hypothetical protein
MCGEAAERNDKGIGTMHNNEQWKESLACIYSIVSNDFLLT